MDVLIGTVKIIKRKNLFRCNGTNLIIHRRYRLDVNEGVSVEWLGPKDSSVDIED